MNTHSKKNIILIGIMLAILCLESCTVSIATAWKNKGSLTQKQENSTKIDSTEFKTNINQKTKKNEK